jgi:RNA polymerase sigma-70 factor, ECF subfamily
MRSEAAQQLLVAVPAGLGERVAERLRRAWADRDVVVVLTRDGLIHGATPRPLDLPLPWRVRRHRDRLRAFELAPVPELAVAEARAGATLTRIAEGDAAAMRELFEAWFEPAYAYVRAMLADSLAAGEVTVDAFLELRRDPPRLTLAGERFRAQLVRRLDAAVRAAGAAPDDELTEPAAQPARPDVDSARRAQLIADLDLVVLVDRLPLGERRVLLLRHVVGLDATEVARACGWEEATVARLHAAGLARLRERLDAFGRCTTGDHTRVAMRAFGWGSPVLRSRRRALAL